ncbi:MAG TPA: DUF3223 domain-containing protein [Roseobacter sp.]|uniref:DUF3223 domain-containing protein n=1 Tax=marine sediment metagenome TaxID=412755 RepID=A0A0F9T204_9ZZZZ|nr:DUF3223 domain-containing protein [Roseobacter sp.]
MARKIPVTVGGIEYESKKDAIEHFKKMLNRYDIGDRVSAGDQAELHELVKRHPEAEARIGTGVESFSVRDGDFGTQCFSITRLDGTTQNFSFRACI